MKLFIHASFPFLDKGVEVTTQLALPSVVTDRLIVPPIVGSDHVNTLQGSDPIVSADRSDDADLEVRGR